MKRRISVLLMSIFLVLSVSCSTPAAPQNGEEAEEPNTSTSSEIEQSTTTTTTTEVIVETSQTHVVIEGDTWWGIAFNYGVDIEELAAANDKSTEDIIHPGDELILPSFSESTTVEATTEESTTTTTTTE